MKFFIVGYFTINIVMLLALLNEGEIIRNKDLNVRGRIANGLFCLLFGAAIAICIILAYAAKPYWISYKWHKRQKKIRLMQLKIREREKPKDIHIIDF
jgi:hypothetical protein